VAERLFLHVGTPKSGTTFLQSVWWANKPQLLEQGLLLPGPGVREHYWASCVVRARRQLRNIPPEGHGSLDRLVEEAGQHPGDVLISHELFSPAPPDRAAAALRLLESAADEVHVVLTARDLMRQIPAEWQQRTKHGRAQTFTEFLHMIQHDGSVNFWRVQDVPAVLTRWSQGIPDERVHLLVLPPPGGPQSFLWDKACAILGVDGTGMAERAARSNESLGLVEVETLRRVSAMLAREGIPKSTERLMKDFVAEEIFRSEDPEKIVVPASVQPWVVSRAQDMVDELVRRRYDVVGELSHLVPAQPPAAGRLDEEVTDGEVAAVAVRALARWVRHEDARRRQQQRRTERPDNRLRARVRRRLSSVRRRLQRR
jgi:hypothetical protein